MKLKENILIIEKSILEEQIEEFKVSIDQPQIEKIIIKTDDLCAEAIQILWCLDKKIEVESKFLEKFFENVKVNA